MNNTDKFELIRNEVKQVEKDAEFLYRSEEAVIEITVKNQRNWYGITAKLNRFKERFLLTVYTDINNMKFIIEL